MKTESLLSKFLLSWLPSQSSGRPPTYLVLGLGLSYAKTWSSPYKLSSYDEKLKESVKSEIDCVAETENKQVAAW